MTPLSFHRKAIFLFTTNAALQLHSINPANAFAPIDHSRVLTRINTAKKTASRILPISNSAVVNGDVGSTDSPKAWECDEDANCVQVDACDDEKCRTTLDVRIHGEWYDLSGECAVHPKISFTNVEIF
jgi:hypothetical protein